jgi:DsbC/DsbD-like thiol-disulfide interchange protein
MTMIDLHRRAILGLGASLLLPGVAMAETTPWQARLLHGSFDGKAHVGGLHLSLASHWKTYWRQPGAGGIPPTIEARGSNLLDFSFSCPVPRRIDSAEGQAIGYLNEVVFPFRATPRDPLQELSIAVDAFVGVCDKICIPVPVQGTMVFPVANTPSPDVALLQHWLQRLPQPSATLVSRASVNVEGSEFWLTLDLLHPVDDVFVEGAPMLFFNAPQWSADRRSARLRVSGAKQVGDVTSTPLRVTAAMAATGLEQVVDVV